MKSALCLLLFTSLASPVLADQSLGVTTLDVVDADLSRPLQLSLWYPGQGGPEEIVAGNAVFSGETAVRDASTTEQTLPLVLVSHGGLRSAGDSGAWLSADLARSGSLVVEINGPRPSTAAQALNEIWHRPNDISRALDTVLDDPDWSKRIDMNRITVVGFALGGTAAMMLSGANLDAQSFVQSCDTPYRSPDCGWYEAQNVSLGSVDIEELALSREDPRISLVVAIAPEYIHAFADGLSAINTPTQIVLLGRENDLSGDGPADITVTAIPDANVSDAFQICTPAGPEILAEDGGDPSLCGPSAQARRDMHTAISNSVLSFLPVGASH